MFPKISPDGKTIAFTGQYDGNTEVYIMPIDGGVPKRLTYTATLSRDDVSDRMGPNNIVMAWTPDSKNIIFRSRRFSFNSFRGQLFSVHVNGNLPTEVPILDGGFCSFNEDGTKLAFNKIFREFRTWKYYKGGMADDIWIYDYKTKKAYKLFENPAQDIFPMWYKDKIYFLSDRDRIMNLFVYDLKTKKVEKITNFTDFDIKFPSIGGDKIVFEKGGYLFYYDIPTGKINKITVYIKNDYPVRNKLIDASKFVKTVDASPDGKRLVVSAHGDIFNVPSKKGVTLNLTNTDSIHERNAAWSPDGKYIAYISDKTGTYEIYIQKPEGGEPIQLTKNGETYKFRLKWSPDGKKILWYDKMLRLRYIDINTKKITEVDKSDTWEISQFNWSPDSRYITYVLPEREHYGRIFIFDTQTEEKHPVTEGWYVASSPSFSLDGRYLLFASARDFSPIYSDLEWNAIYKNMERI
jgi:tricorn protease